MRVCESKSDCRYQRENSQLTCIIKHKYRRIIDRVRYIMQHYAEHDNGVIQCILITASL